MPGDSGVAHRMTILGIVGSGPLGSTVTRLAVKAGIDVVLSNSRGPETLADLVAKLGPHATAMTAEQAARTGDLVVVAIPFRAYKQLAREAFAGKVVLDANNYYPSRDGDIPGLKSGEWTSSELLQQHLDGSLVVKALNNI